MEETLQSIGFGDVADMLVISVCTYFSLRWIQSTSSRGLGYAAAAIVGVFLFARRFDLYLTTMLFEFGLTIGAVVIVVVFQEDIRRAVEGVLLMRIWRNRGGDVATSPHIETLVESAFDLASKNRGALVVIAGSEPLDRHLSGGEELLGRISQPLLESLFDPHSAGHDGAVIVAKGFVTRFGVHLPLSQDRQKSLGLGTRHRSALGLSESTDALVIVVSEERGQVSLARDGVLTRDVSRDSLSDSLKSHLKEAKKSKGRKSVVFRHPRTKLASLAIAAAVWVMFAAERDIVRQVFVIPIEYRNVPTDVSISDSVPTEARVTFSGSERAFRFLAPSSLKVSLDVSDATAGKAIFNVTESSVRHPPSLSVDRIEPRSIRIND